jgi:hypothetical protein
MTANSNINQLAGRVSAPRVQLVIYNGRAIEMFTTELRQRRTTLGKDARGPQRESNSRMDWHRFALSIPSSIVLAVGRLQCVRVPIWHQSQRSPLQVWLACAPSLEIHLLVIVLNATLSDSVKDMSSSDTQREARTSDEPKFSSGFSRKQLNNAPLRFEYFYGVRIQDTSEKNPFEYLYKQCLQSRGRSVSYCSVQNVYRPVHHLVNASP